MCGRFSFDLAVELLEQVFALDEVRGVPERSYNVAPPGEGPVVHDEGSERVLSAYRWGLVPGWADDLDFGSRTVNARAETADEKPAFREAFGARRAVVPVSGFFEWQDRPSGRKAPYHFRDPDGGPLPLAGLWEEGSGEGEAVRTFTILTADANQDVEPVHDRMPVILDEEDVDRWLDPEVGGEAVADLLGPAPEGALESYEVSDRVNDAAEDGPDLVEPRFDGGQPTRLDDF